MTYHFIFTEVELNMIDRTKNKNKNYETTRAVSSHKQVGHRVQSDVSSKKIKLNFDLLDSLMAAHTTKIEKQGKSILNDKEKLNSLIISLGYDLDDYDTIDPLAEEGVNISLIQILDTLFSLKIHDQHFKVISNLSSGDNKSPKETQYKPEAKTPLEEQQTQAIAAEAEMQHKLGWFYGKYFTRYQLLLHRFQIINKLKVHPLLQQKSVQKTVSIYTDSIFKKVIVKRELLMSDEVESHIRRKLVDSFLLYKVLIANIVSCYLTSTARHNLRKLILNEINFERENVIGNVNDLPTFLALCHGYFSTPAPYTYPFAFSPAQHLQISTYFEEIEMLYLLEWNIRLNLFNGMLVNSLLKQVPITQLITVPYSYLSSGAIISGNQFAHIIDLLNINVSTLLLNFCEQVLPHIPPDGIFPLPPVPFPSASSSVAVPAPVPVSPKKI